MVEGQFPSYKHAIAANGIGIAGLPSQNAYGGWQKICHIIPPWWPWHCYCKKMQQIPNHSAMGFRSFVAFFFFLL